MMPNIVACTDAELKLELAYPSSPSRDSRLTSQDLTRWRLRLGAAPLVVENLGDAMAAG